MLPVCGADDLALVVDGPCIRPHLVATRAEIGEPGGRIPEERVPVAGLGAPGADDLAPDVDGPRIRPRPDREP